MARGIVPPEGFSLDKFNRDWELSQLQKGSVISVPLEQLKPDPTTSFRPVYARCRQSGIDPSANVEVFQADVRALLYDKYKLDGGGDRIVSGQSLTHLIKELRWGGRSGIRWAVPTRFYAAEECFERYGFSFAQGRGTRSYWKDGAWGGRCTVVFEKEKAS